MHFESPETVSPERTSQVRLPARVVNDATGSHELLRGLLTTGAGVLSGHAGHLRRGAVDGNQAVLAYCLKGGGWCELAGRLHAIRKGYCLVIPQGISFACGTHAAKPWTIRWVQATGIHLPVYLKHLAVSVQVPVFPGGEDLHIVRLLDEILRSLQRGPDFVHLLRASQALAHLFATLIDQRGQRTCNSSDTVQKIGETIIYISDHLDERLRVAALARMASLSPDHFGELFKEQTGCSPRDYLHLLRIHRACQFLQESALTVKQISARLGYQDQFHFSRQFKAFQGLSPSQYRQTRHH